MVAYAFLLQLVSYDAERYVLVFSAIIPGVSTIFALVAAGTLLLIERIGSRSPRALSFLPIGWVSGLFIFFASVIAFDILAMLHLSSDASFSWLVDSLLVLNMACIALTILYFENFSKWLRPESLYSILLQRGSKTKSKEEAVEIANSVQELANEAIQRHDTLSTVTAIETCQCLCSVFCTRWRGENIGAELYHPVRVVCECAGSITMESVLEERSKLGAARLGEDGVTAICSMASDMKENGLAMETVWIHANIKSIVDQLIMSKFGAAAIAVVIIKAKIAIDADRLDLAHWLTCVFPTWAETAASCEDLESMRMLAIGIEILAEAFQTKTISTYTAATFFATIKALERIAKKGPVGSYTGLLSWTTERTLADILKYARNLTTQAARKSVKPTQGQRPTSH